MSKLILVLALLFTVVAVRAAHPEVDTQNPSPPSFAGGDLGLPGASCPADQNITSPTTGAVTNWHCTISWMPGTTWECTSRPDGHGGYTGSCVCVAGYCP